jgi:hypothetical protein
MEAYLDKLVALQGLGLDLEAGKLDLPSEMGITDVPVMSETSSMSGQDIPVLSSEDVVATTLATTPLVTELLPSEATFQSSEDVTTVPIEWFPSISTTESGAVSTEGTVLATSSPPVTTVKYPETTLKGYQDRVYNEREPLSQGSISPGNPEVPKSLATIESLAKPKQKAVLTSSTTSSPDLADLRRRLEEGRQAWLKREREKKIQMKKDEMAKIVDRMATVATPPEVTVPMMSGNIKMMANPMATDSTLQVPLGIGSRITKGNSTLLILDMQTGKGVAMFAGLIGSGMFFPFNFFFNLLLLSSFFSFILRDHFLLGFFLALSLVFLILVGMAIKRRGRMARTAPEVVNVFASFRIYYLKAM